MNTAVLPALQRVLGPRLLYPEVVLLTAPDPDKVLLGSTNTMVVTSEGAISTVDAPRVAVAEDDDVLRLLLVYELAQFHELSTRKHAQLKLDKEDASTLWCAYFAHRVTSKTGLVPVELLRGTGLGLPRAMELVWLEALGDVDPGHLGWLAERGGDFADALRQLAELDLPDHLYQDFPDWDDQDPVLCAGFFGAIGSLGSTLELLAEARRKIIPAPE